MFSIHASSASTPVLATSTASSISTESTATTTTIAALSSVSSATITAITTPSPAFSSIKASSAATPVLPAPAASSSWVSSSPWSSNVHLNLLTTDGGSVHHLLCLVSLLLRPVGDEGVPFAAVVGVGDIAKPF